MIPVWLPWILVGGGIFIALSYIGAKYRDKEYKNIQFAQDFISGAIFVALIGMIMPDLFPEIDFELPSMSTNEFDLQIGPPRLIGK